jgi:hypothetical protein
VAIFPFSYGKFLSVASSLIMASTSVGAVGDITFGSSLAQAHRDERMGKTRILKTIYTVYINRKSFPQNLAPLAGQIPPLLATPNSPTPDRLMAL